MPTALMKNPFTQQIAKEIFISFAVLAAYRFIGKVPIPFIDPGGVTIFSHLPGKQILFSIEALGIMPYVSAFVLVEICSLFLPFLKKHRGGAYSGRLVLQRYALLLTLLLSILQGTTLIHGISRMTTPTDVPIWEFGDSLHYIAMLSTLVASVFFLLSLAEIATRHGIGNGISLLILAGSCSGLYNHIVEFFTRDDGLQHHFFYLIVFSIFIFFLFIVVSIVLSKAAYTIPLRHHTDESCSGFFTISFCLSGKEFVVYATSLVLMPTTLLSFAGAFQPIARLLAPYSVGYYIFVCLFVFLLSYLFGWLFLYPEKRLATLKQWGWTPSEGSQFSIASFKRRFLLINLPWSLFLSGVILVSSFTITGYEIPLRLSGSSLFLIAFLGLDIVSRLKLWNEKIHDKTFKLAEFQDVHYATMIKNHLESENIRFYLQGYYHRHLLYFFGPYIPINLMIPLSEKNRATEIISRYYNGLGLV